MEEFLRKFIQLNGAEAKVVLNHCLFNKQTFYCDELQTINNDEKIGLILKGQAVFMYKQNVKVVDWSGKVCTISDGRLTITIICK